MLLFDALVALLVTLALGAPLLAALGWRRRGAAARVAGPSWHTAALLLLGLYLLVLTGGRLLRPLGFGPAGATWTPFLLVGLLLSLLVLALAMTAPGGPRAGGGPRGSGAAALGAAQVDAARLGAASRGSNATTLLLLGLVAALAGLWVLLLLLSVLRGA